MANKEDSGSKGAVKSFLAGGAGGMSLVFVGHPLDTIKVKMQTAAKGEYAGMVDVFRRTVASEGVKGLYRGMSAPLVGVTPIFALYFLGFDQGKRIATSIGGPLVKENGEISNMGIMFGGGFSALPGTLLMVPGDRMKVIAQAAKPGEYSGPMHILRTIVKNEGALGLYKGTVLTLWRDMPGSVAYYGMYEFLKEALTPADGKMSTPTILFAGGMAGIANWLVAVPPDVVKSRFQNAPKGKYSGGGAVLRELIATEGLSSMYKGLGPAMARAVPANAACFLGFEYAMAALNRYW